MGDVTIKAGSTTSADGQAAGGGVSLFAGVGVSVAKVSAGGSAKAHSDGDITGANDLTISATATNSATVDTHAVGLAAGVAAAINVANATIDGETRAYLGSGSTTYVLNDAEITASSDNTVTVDGFGAALGLGAGAGIMVGESKLGQGDSSDEVVAAVESGAEVQRANGLSVSAQSTDHVFTSTVAAGGGLVAGIAGASSTSRSDQATLARIGANASVMAQTVSLASTHTQEVDAKADAYSFGLAAGAGGFAQSVITSKANIDVGSGADITAHNVVLSAVNTLDKNHFSTNLHSGSAGLGAGSFLESTSDIGTASHRFQAVVTIGSGAHITAVGHHADPALLRFSASNDIEATDHV